jgi:hypothetical protein
MTIDWSLFRFGKGTPRSVVKIAKDRAAKAQETRTRKKVDKRDKHRCFYPNCRVPACHKHHQIYRSKGGTWTADNIVSGCNKHHRWVHDGLIRLVGNPDKPPLGGGTHEARARGQDSHSRSTGRLTATHTRKGRVGDTECFKCRRVSARRAFTARARR